MHPFLLEEASVMLLNYSWYRFPPSEVPACLLMALLNEGYHRALLSARPRGSCSSSHIVGRGTKFLG